MLEVALYTAVAGVCDSRLGRPAVARCAVETSWWTTLRPRTAETGVPDPDTTGQQRRSDSYERVRRGQLQIVVTATYQQGLIRSRARGHSNKVHGSPREELGLAHAGTTTHKKGDAMHQLCAS